jgi:hypothetical protein
MKPVFSAGARTALERTLVPVAAGATSGALIAGVLAPSDEQRPGYMRKGLVLGGVIGYMRRKKWHGVPT